MKEMENILGHSVTYLDCWDQASIKLGKVYLFANSFQDRRDVHCAKDLISEIANVFDAVVHETFLHMDAKYASTQGLLESNIPQYLGPQAIKLGQCYERMQNAQMGLVLGGANVAWQIKFIQAHIKRLKFVAVAGEVASVFMENSDEIISHLYDDLQTTKALLKKAKVQIIYPVDVVAYSPDTQRNRICLHQDLEPQEQVMDIATRSRERIVSYCMSKDVDFIVFSGVVGAYFDPRYARNCDLLIKDIARIDKDKMLMGKVLRQAAIRLGVIESYAYAFDADVPERQYLALDQQIQHAFEDIEWQ